MRIRIDPKSRAQMITVGKRVGQYIKGVRDDEPWIVTINGDPDAGKSLLAFGIDAALSPEKYSGPIGRDLNADTHLNHTVYPDSKTVFYNFASRAPLSVQEYNEELFGALHRLRYGTGTKLTSPKLKVLVAANIETLLGPPTQMDATSSLQYQQSLKRLIEIRVNLLPDRLTIEVYFPADHHSEGHRLVDLLGRPFTRSKAHKLA